MGSFPNITDFSHELLCQILKYLPLREILSVAMLCKKMSIAVDMHLRLCKCIDFCQDSIYGYMPSTITDENLLILLKKCPHLETVYGLHPVKIERRRLRKRSALTIPGIIEALSLCFHLKAVETSDLRLFEAIMQHLPHIEIIGHFQNRDGLFPPQASQRLKLQPYPRISSLHLIGVEVPELTAMPHLQHLHLQCVRFTRPHPFRDFFVQNLKSFVMKHCIGPSGPHRYMALIIGLSSAPNLSHLELVRVPVVNGLFQRAVEDHNGFNGFANLRSLIISGCKGVLEADLGHLMIISSKTLETLYIQPSLTKDSLFVSLSYAQCIFPRLQNLHIGYIDTLNSAGEWSNDALLSFGLAEVPDTPSSITDSGMKVICELFPHIKSLSVSNCPHLMVMYHWMSPGDEEAWSRLTDLTLQKCHCLQLSSFAVFVAFLSHIEVVILNDMFREPPKGCSHVGLSAGTGLGMSSAVVSNQDEHIAVQGHHQDFEHPGDEENEENEREFIDVENEEPHFMVLQRDFFDGEEEEEEDSADVPLEGQDPVNVREQINGEDYGNADNSLNDNLQQMNNDVRANENTFCHGEPSTSTNNKACCGPLLSTEDQNLKESKNEIVSTSKDCSSSDCVKSVQVQCDALPIDCFPSSSNSDLKNAEKKFHQGDDISNDSFKSDDVKLCVCDKRSNYNYYSDYDPHKPSTSKAGRHLDYSVTTHRDSSDSDTDICKHDRSSKRLKKASDKKCSPKVKIEKLDTDKFLTKTSESSESYNNFPKSGKNHYSKTSNKSVLHSQNHGNNSTVSLNEMYKLIKPCKILIPKIELSPVNTSNICTENIDAYTEFKECSFPENTLSNSASCCSVKEDYNDKDSFKNDESFETNDQHNLIISSTNQKPLISPNFKESLTHKIENSKPSAEILAKKTNSIVNGDSPESMMCCVCVKKLDNNDCHEMLENSVEDKKTANNSYAQDMQNFEECNTDSFIIKNEGYADNICENSSELIENCKYLEQENTSSCSHMEVDNCLVSACKTECITDSDNFITNESYDNKYFTRGTTDSPSGFVIINSQQICKEVHYETKDFCSVLDNKNELNECESNKMLDCELSLKENQPKNVWPDENEASSHSEAETDRSESQVIDPVCEMLFCMPLYDSFSDVNTDTDQNGMSNNTGKSEETLKLNSGVQISKLHDEELTKKSQKRNFNHYHIEPRVATKRVNLLNEKQNDSTYSENSYEEYSSVPNVKKPCCGKTYSSISRNTRSKVSQIPDPYKPSTSRDGCDCPECSSILPRSTKYSNSVRYKKRITSVTPCTQHTDSSNITISSESKGISGMQSVKNSVKGKKHPVDCSKINVESSEPIAKKIKKINQSKSDKDTESKYFVVVSDTSTEIINSSTGESCTVAPCSVHLTQTDIRNSNADISDITTKSCMCNYHETEQNKTIVVVNCDPCSPSTSSSSKTSKDSVCKDCKNMSDQLDSSTFSNSRKEKLKITNSDASILMNNPKENNQLNLHSEYKSMWQNSSDNHLGNGPNKVFKTESGVEKNSDEKCASEYQNNIYIKTENVSDSTDKSAAYSYKKRTRKKGALSQKRGKKIKKDPLIKSDISSKHLKCRAKKVPTVPMVCLISQGTQANSADIRRSVRRIRRAAARTRRTVSSLRVSRNSSHSNKISAKMLNKKPVSMNPRPETHDKATSTSDPLLEDDAVQTLQLTSKSLLSFTIVSCGISDIIIDRCPKLFHFEVQACRILKKFHLNHCSSLKQLNVAQCPKLSICALAAPVMSLDIDSNFLISYEPCMQGYHPGDGEKAALSRATLNQNVVLCHDFNDISHEGIQAMFKDKLMQWFHHLSKFHVAQNCIKKRACEISNCSEYPWSHNLRKIYGNYTYTPSSDFHCTEGQYQLLTNNPLLCDIFETHQLESGFPTFNDCDAFEDISVISRESIEKFYNMEKKFIGFYIPITENNQINF